MSRRARGAAVAGLVVAMAACATVPASTTSAASAQSRSRTVAFVPLGGYPRSEAAALARHFGRRLGLQTSVLSGSALPRSAFNRARKQYVAEKLIDVVAARRAGVGSRTVLIGLTTEDMHTVDRPEWRFSFSIRHPSGLAVVSRARMDPLTLGLFPDPALRMRRLRKMVAKNIGVLSLGLSQSGNPRSALYDMILSTDDLDLMTEEFAPAAPAPAKTAWLGRSARVCTRGIAEARRLNARSTLVTREDVLAYAEKSLALADRRYAELASIPAPREERAAVRALLARFDRARDAGRAGLARLRARWSDATFKRWAENDLRYSLALKADALELGSRPCARYFDPATYVR